MQKLSIFQVVLIGIFIFGLLVAVGVFSGLVELPSLRVSQQDEVTIETLETRITIWGTIDSSTVNDVLDEHNPGEELTLSYRQIPRNSFNETLLEALASGNAPDLVIMSEDMIMRNRNKLFEIPYRTISQREYRSQFVQAAELYQTENGYVGLPLFADPMLLYYNRTLLESAGYSLPPTTWSELYEYSKTLTQRTPDNTILQSGVAFGRYGNVTNAKGILSLLYLQVGNPIVRSTGGGQYAAALNESEATIAATTFYTQFADPVKEVYSWNSAQPSSHSAFLSQDLAFYFGYSSELFALQERNPNLNFDITTVPQYAGSKAEITHGSVYGVAIPAASRQRQAALLVAQWMTLSDVARDLSASLRIAPMRRDIIATEHENPYVNVFYDAALQVRTWLDPDPQESDAIFEEMIRDITSGRRDVASAIDRATARLGQLIRSIAR